MKDYINLKNKITKDLELLNYILNNNTIMKTPHMGIKKLQNRRRLLTKCILNQVNPYEKETYKLLEKFRIYGDLYNYYKNAKIEEQSLDHHFEKYINNNRNKKISKSIFYSCSKEIGLKYGKVKKGFTINEALITKRQEYLRHLIKYLSNDKYLTIFFDIMG